MDFDATERDIVTPTVSTTLHGSTPMGSTEKWCGQNADHTTQQKILNLTSIQYGHTERNNQRFGYDNSIITF